MRWSLLIPALLLLGATTEAGGSGDAGTRLRYGRDVRPILADRCFVCHGPDSAKRQAGLRLDDLASATAERDGAAAIVPGVLEESELWRRINHPDRGERMPPADSNRKQLSAQERALLGRWIEQGATYEPHWAFVAPERPSVPAADGADAPGNPIDHFLRAAMARQGVEPSPPAPPEAQLRRLFLDLTGLPPTPEELLAFLEDPAPERYERQVARLLEEQPYRSRHAERMAVPWLDQARYADTSGIHMDAGRQTWLWRDWVLEAYRDNMPFDRFLTEQLAGDLLPDASVAQKIASGFNRQHVTTDEGGAIDAEYLVEYAVDRSATTGLVFLGLTMGCARCHEHKFDPISQEEFYGFYAFFNSNEEPGLYSQVPDANRALEPFLEVPSDEQSARLVELKSTITQQESQLDEAPPGEEETRAAFFGQLLDESGLRWRASEVLGARSLEGSILSVQADGSVLVTGDEPEDDEHELRLRTDALDLRLLALEALLDPLYNSKLGRASHGNAVLSGVTLEAVSVVDPSVRERIPLVWAWADVEQQSGEFGVWNALDSDALGWAVDGTEVPGGRVALFLAQRPFGYEGGTELIVRLAYRSSYKRHALGRVRLSVGSIAESGLDALPVAAGDWLVAGPFETGPSPEGYSASFGPELDPFLDRGLDFDGQSWRFIRRFSDGRVNGELTAGVNLHYLGRRLFAPSARSVTVALGSDDGYRLFLDGLEVSSREVDRGVAAAQDEVTLELSAGVHTLCLVIVNTGGQAGFAWEPRRRERELLGGLLLAFAPPNTRSAASAATLARSWRLAFSEDYRGRVEALSANRDEKVALEGAIPRTMVMQELAEPRETFLLTRGAYDHPDKQRPITRAVPAVLGSLPEDAPRDRRGLAQWMVAPGNPLVARVAANRLWELIFGTGIVRTSEDFGQQGDWPSHPELLDWLALELRESGWDVQHLLRLMVTSEAYRQSSRVRPELAERDPDNRLLAYLPRRRLSAEAIRDQALYVSGLLVEQLGGPSVKPYQPEGLWREVAMLQSNTREFKRDEGAALWRRSLYTYWKRACPPPSLMAFDAPTREFCTIRRTSTNTPLQALVLWNDVQFVEAARVLAARTLAEECEDDAARIERLFMRCATRLPEAAELEALTLALQAFRARYGEAPEEAAALLEVGESMAPEELDPVELAAWSMLANALLNLDAVITRT